jgi:hypothetical protein
MRDAVQEVRGAVEGIDVPAMCLVRPLDHALFLHDEAVARTSPSQGIAQDRLRLAVRGGDEVARTLARDLQVLDLAEVALERTGGFHDRVGHHGHQRGADHVTFKFWPG